METKHAKENNKKPIALPQNYDQLKRIKERKLEQFDNTIKELQEQKEELKKTRF
jgi:hypothetical protein